MVRTEEGHDSVTVALREALDAGRKLITTSYVVVETTALLQQRFGLPAVRDLNATLLPLCGVVWIDEPTHRRALDRLFRADRRRLSLVDCTSFVVMESEGIRDVLALDTDFATEGFRLLPG